MSHMADPQFLKVIREAIAGSGEARGQLFASIHNYLLLISNQELDTSLERKIGASDIVQQTYVNAINGLENFRGDTENEFRSWLRTILLREITRQRRAYGRQKRNHNRERYLDADDSGHRNGVEPVDQEVTPSSQAIISEQLSLLQSALLNLSDDYRTVVQLRNIRRMKFAEIGKLLGRSEEAVRKLWKRAIIQLNSELKKNE